METKRKTTTSTKEVYRCFYCDKRKHRTAFYIHEVYYSKSKITPICKECASRIANRVEYGVTNGMTMDSLLLTLRLMDKPFIRSIYDTAVQASKNTMADAAHTRTVFGNYVATLVKSQYWSSTWDDTEMKSTAEVQAEIDRQSKPLTLASAEDDVSELEINRKDTIRLIGYDVFENEPTEDKPLLYAQLIKYLDASPESNEDAMKVSSIVQIVKAYYQADKINNVIADIMSDPKKLLENASTLKSLQSTQKTLMDTALSLAKDNGISFNHNKSNSKGANTLSGKLKKMKELNLREIEVNAFDIGTSEGMRKVADISNASILDQIRLNENDIPEMLADQRLLIEKWEKTAYKASEQARILLRENRDLKEYLRSVGYGEAVDNHSFKMRNMDGEDGINDADIYTEEFQQMMRGPSNDVWALLEDANTEDILHDTRIDVEYKEVDPDDDDGIIVDPEDIVASDEVEEGE